MDVPNGAKVSINVSSEESATDGYFYNGDVNVGSFEGIGPQAFIVSRDAVVSYTVEQDYYNTMKGNFIVGKTTGANVTEGKKENVTINKLDTSENMQKINITLSKKIYKHTITSAGATITATGYFTDAQGNNAGYSRSSAAEGGKLEFYVWSHEDYNDVNYTVTRTYYDTATGSINVNSNNATTPVNLNRRKYYATLDQTGELTFKNGTRNVNATWSWTTEERNKASGTKWNVVPEGFEVDHGLINIDGVLRGETNISYGGVQYSGGLPNRMTITFSNNIHTRVWNIFKWDYDYDYYDRKFKIGTVYVILDN